MAGERKSETSRRSFLRTVGRGVGVAALGGLAWAVGFRTGNRGARVKSTRSRCGRCVALSLCSRPDALQVRDVLGLEPNLGRIGRINGAERLCEGSAEERSSSTIES